MKDIPALHNPPEGVAVKDVIDHYEIWINHNNPESFIAGLIVTGFSILVFYIFINYGQDALCSSTTNHQHAHECTFGDYAIAYLIIFSMLVFGLVVTIWGINNILSKTKICIYENGCFTIQKIGKFIASSAAIIYYPNEDIVLERIPQSGQNNKVTKWSLLIQNSKGAKYSCELMSESKWQWLERTLCSLFPNIHRK